jgi:succinate dehydrogenase / fumarate reductase membrane anchor subunit
MHVTNDVAATSYDFIANRYANPFWRVYDLSLLTLALLHGMNGMRVIVDDYVHSRGWNLAWQSFMGLITLIFWLTGAMNIIMFNPGSVSPSAAFIQTVIGVFHH